MPVFMVERRFADQLEVDPETAASINRINDEAGVRWLKSFLSSRQAQDLLPLRGRRRRGDPHGRHPRRHPGRCDHGAVRNTVSGRFVRTDVDLPVRG